MPLVTLTIPTAKKYDVIDMTLQIGDALRALHAMNGLCCIAALHSTTGLTLMENADKNIPLDFQEACARLIPEGIWQHDAIDDNGAAHLKSALLKPSLCIPVEKSSLILGTWQAVALCEFDGPKERKVVVQFIPG